MNKEELIKLKEKIASLTEEEKKKRNLYLRNLSLGKIQGPPTGYASIDKPWLGEYSESAILEGPDKKSIYRFMFDNNKSNMNDIAIEYLSTEISYFDLRKIVDRISEILYVNYQIREGDVVTLLMANIPQNTMLIYALNRIGAIANLVYVGTKGETLINEINNVNSKMVFCTDIFLKNIMDVKDKIVTKNIIVTSPSEYMPNFIKSLYFLKQNKIKPSSDYTLWNDFINQNFSIENEFKESAFEENCACILHTSGTTGDSKGVMISNNAFNNMVYEYANSGIDFKRGESFFNQVPPFLAYNIIMATHLPLTLGLRVVMYPNYEPENFAKNIAKYKINHAIAGPADWTNFLEIRNLKINKYEQLKTLASGSDKLSEENKEKIYKILGKNVIEGYGCTEGGSAVITNLPNALKKDSVGIPLPLNNVGIFSEDNGEIYELGYGEVGEICFTGPTMMLKYFDNEIETEKVMKKHRDGNTWIHTGDVGYINADGFLYLKGRIKRLIIRYDGQKVSPYDIENIVSKIDIVDNCCVIAGDDYVNGRGSVPIIYLSLKDIESSLNIKNIILEKCKEMLSLKEQPFDVIVIDEIPLTLVGKVNYKLLEKDYNEGIKKKIRNK
jgi:long-chain acyl-CoA synthetase